MLKSHVRHDGTVFFAFHYHDTNQVHVAGDFSDWNPVPLHPAGDGWWTVALDTGGDRPFRYKFVTNGRWYLDQFNLRRSPDGLDSMMYTGGSGGQLTRGSFFSPVLGRDKEYAAYLPPSFPFDTERKYPCLVLLPGLLDDAMTWSGRTDLEYQADHLMGSGQIPEMVIVMPDKDDTMFHEETWGAYGSYIDGDLRAHSTGEYRLREDGDGWAIEGLSLGGAWALRLSAWHPGNYISVSGLSCAFSDDIAESLAGAAPTLRQRGVRFRLACGDEEGRQLFEATWGFGQYIRDLGLSCETRMDHGPHDWPLWSRQLPHSMAFHGWTFANAGND